MSWVKIDDRIFDNPKIAALSDAAKVAYLESIAYCARELTDGFVPDKKAAGYAGRARIAQELVPHLWEPVAAGYLVHDYLKYNPPRAQVLAEREAARARMSGRTSPTVQGDVQAKFRRNSKAPVDPVDPLLPDPVKPAAPTPGETALLLAGRPLIFKLYEELFGVGRLNGLMAEKLKEVEAEWGEECITHCFQEAAEANARSWKLVNTILERHRQEGCYAGRPGGDTAPGSTAAESPYAGRPGHELAKIIVDG